MPRREDAHASAELTPEVYEQLRSIAASYFRGQRGDVSLQPTVLLHEAYLRLAAAEDRGARFVDRAHFCATAARAMRQILIDRARRRAASKRGGEWRRVSLSLVGDGAGGEMVDLLALDRALEALEELSPRQSRIVELRFFGGSTVEEIAAALDVSASTVEKEWRRARAWLAATLGSDWRRG